MRSLLPSADEQQHLGRFYLSTFLMEATHLAMPFQVLLIVKYLDLPAVGWVIFIEQLVSLAMEVPTGAWADRFGRKRCVLAGHLIGAIGWLLVPPATWVVEHTHRLAAVSAAFGLVGAGAALISGAKESWVYDNLKSVGRRDLALRFFSRDHSAAAAGGILADVVAIAILCGSFVVDLRLFWIATGLGELFTLGVLARTPEHPVMDDADEERQENEGQEDEAKENEDDPDEDEEELEEFEAPWMTMREAVVAGFAGILSQRALVALVLMLAWSTAAFGLSSEAFQAALADLHFKDVGFAWLELGNDALGIFVPLLAIWLAQRLSGKSLLALGIVLPAAAAACVWLRPEMSVIIGVYLFVLAWTGFFHAVADDYQHGLLSSATRATASSAINLVVTLAELGSAFWLAVLLDSLSPTTAIAIMGLAALPSVLLLVPKNRPTGANA